MYATRFRTKSFLPSVVVMSRVCSVMRLMNLTSNSSLRAIDGMSTWELYAASRSIGNVSRTYSNDMQWFASSHICFAR